MNSDTVCVMEPAISVQREYEEVTVRGMSPEQKIHCARDFRDITHENLQFSSRRGSELADEFTRLEVQIATLLFAFAGLFVNSFKGLRSDGFSDIGVFLMQITFAVSIFFLIASLVSGLLHIKRKEKFWDEVLQQRAVRFDEWDKVVRREITFEQGHSFHVGTSAGKVILSSPRWTWILQTIFLGISVALLFGLALVFLFA